MVACPGDGHNPDPLRTSNGADSEAAPAENLAKTHKNNGHAGNGHAPHGAPPLGEPPPNPHAPDADQPNTLDVALSYQRAGIAVLPIVCDGKKKPPWSWKKYQQHRPGADKVRGWFSRKGVHFGIATICGAVSGNLELLDFDKEADTIFPAWHELVEAERTGLTARLSVVRTPSGGYHVRYRVEQPVPGNDKLATYLAGPKDEHVLIETRGEGGYALAPGSPLACHSTERPYLHHSGPPLTDLQTISAAEREVLIRCASSFNRKAVGSGLPSSGSGQMPGDDYSARGPDWSVLLEPHGWTVARQSGDVRFWRRPGKEGDGWSATTGVCRNNKGHELLAVFSSNAAPFDGPGAGRPCGIYTKFAAHALLDHGGDFAGAAKALAQEGYGERRSGPKGPPPASFAGDGNGDEDKEIDSDDPHQTDLGNACRLVDRHGDRMRYCHLWKKWLVWDGCRWRLDDTGEADRLAKDTIIALYESTVRELQCVRRRQDMTPKDKKAEIERLSYLLKWCLNSESAKSLNAILQLARSEPDIPVLPNQLDRNPWLLNCPNGTLDLRTGTLREHRQADRLTKLCPTEYHPDATCPTWEKLLAGVFDGDKELVVFQQRLLGYCLTGDVREDVFNVFWGLGGNGKSTVLNAVFEILGKDYAMKAPASFLMAGRGERHPTELADLFGKRLVVASETEQGRRLNEALVKDLTGREPIRARRMREDFWEFEPTHKIILVTNHKPVIRGMDDAVRRRLCLAPFNVKFWDPEKEKDGGKGLPLERRKDKTIPERLCREYAGILAWMVRGCLDWQASGLTMPEKVRAATEEYLQGEDLIARWIEECCHVGVASLPTPASSLYRSFCAWCQRSGEEEVMSVRTFGEALGARGFAKKKSNGWKYLGIGLVAPAERSREAKREDEDDGGNCSAGTAASYADAAASIGIGFGTVEQSGPTSPDDF